MIEVGDSSLGFDRDVKIPLYARSGIPEVWLIDLEEGRVETYAEPAPDGYQRSHLAVRGERLSCAALPVVDLSVDEIVL